MFQCCCNTELHHFGDYVNADEKTIIIMNHRTRVDWNYVWIALYHATQNPVRDICTCQQPIDRPDEDTSLWDIGGKAKLKFVLKDEIKRIPGMGELVTLIAQFIVGNLRHLVYLLLNEVSKIRLNVYTIYDISIMLINTHNLHCQNILALTQNVDIYCGRLLFNTI